MRLPDAESLARIKSINVLVTDLFRLSTRPATEPFFAKSGAYRFDDPSGIGGSANFGVLYVAQDPETAFCESVIHDNALYSGGSFQVSAAILNGRSLVCFQRPAKPVLRLADLTGSGLKALGLNNDISSGEDYLKPQQWSAAIHNAAPALDGIRYVSRQNNRKYCYAVFDRSGVTRDSSAALTSDIVDSLCRKLNVLRV